MSVNSPQPGDRLSETDFSQIKSIAYEDAGLVLPDAKRSMVEARIARRMRASNCFCIGEYLQRLSGSASALERKELISVLTTNVTSFFREAHHFDTLQSEVFPDLLVRARKGQRVRIWSAGSSSGQEAFSLAMLFHFLDSESASFDLRILATDIDHVSLARANTAVYQATELDPIPQKIRKALALKISEDGNVIMPSALRRLVTFKPLNLHEQWPMRGKFDVVLCRNVVIYFDAHHQAALWPRFNAVLKNGGWLFLGHSERLQPIDGSGFRAQGVTTYQKTGAWTGPANQEGC